MSRFRCTFELVESGEVRVVEVLAGHHTEVDEVLEEYVSLNIGAPPAHLVRGHRVMEVEPLPGPEWREPEAQAGLVQRVSVRVASTLSVALRAVRRG